MFLRLHWFLTCLFAVMLFASGASATEKDLDQKVSELADQIETIYSEQGAYRSLPKELLKERAKAIAKRAADEIENEVPEHYREWAGYEENSVRGYFLAGGLVSLVSVYVMSLTGSMGFNEACTAFWAGAGCLAAATMLPKRAQEFLGAVAKLPENLLVLHYRTKHKKLNQQFRAKLIEELEKRQVRVAIDANSECEALLDGQPRVRIGDLEELEFVDEPAQEQKKMQVRR